MKDPKETLSDWLRDAHAMESNLINMLEKQSDRLSDFPTVQQRVASHAEESRRHAELVEQCLERLGHSPSSIKEGVAKLSGKVGPIGAAMAADEPVKIGLANYATEHFEIASYRSLQTAAEHCGEAEIAEVMAGILREEESMAQFLGGEISELTHAHLGSREGVGTSR